jgi:hypothetical protein
MALAPVAADDAVKSNQPLAANLQPPGAAAPPAGFQETLRQDRPPPGLGFDEQGNWQPPKTEELFRMENEQALFERIRREKTAVQQQEGEFPEERHLIGMRAPRVFQPQQAIEFPSYVVYQPLYFQQINTERYGWELGVFQPIISTAQFYGDVVLFPYKVAVDPPWHCDANRGYALPGDAEPLRFLTMPFSWRGVAAEAGAAVGGAAIFP